MAKVFGSVWDVVVVGGGPAGLSAALILGRCLRRVLVVDSGAYRNEAATAVHGFLTRDGTAPAELRAAGRAELARYGVEVLAGEVDAGRRTGRGFRLDLRVGGPLHARCVVLATGLVDTLPPIDGLADLYGRSVHHCPYCDGWEHRGQAIGVYGAAAALARTLRTWSRDVVLFTDGVNLEAGSAEQLSRVQVRVVTERVVRLVGVDGQLRGVEVASGRSLPRNALFLQLAGQRQRSQLAAQLGAVVSNAGVEHGWRGSTAVPGLFVAGDASKDLLLSIVAAAEGAAVGVAVDQALRDLDWPQSASARHFACAGGCAG